jgi:hypothetical protein
MRCEGAAGPFCHVLRQVAIGNEQDGPVAIDDSTTCTAFELVQQMSDSAFTSAVELT